MLVVLENIRSVYNVGSIFRTMDGLGFKKAILIGITPTPLDKKGLPRKDFHKTALGSENTIMWEYFESFSSFYKKYTDLKIISCEYTPRSKSISELNIPQVTKPHTALIFGSEVDGVSPEALNASQEIFHIPMLGKKESFNVSVAAGIFLYEVNKKTV